MKNPFLNSLQIIFKKKKNFALKPISNDPKDDPEYCSTCISFMDNSIDILLNVIANGGILGNCQNLCGYLPDQWECIICDLLCSYVGIEAFIDAIDIEDPDPIYICMELSMCPIRNTAAARIVSLVISPSSGPAGTTFLFALKYLILNETGTGIVQFCITPPASDGSFPFAGYALIIDQMPGYYDFEMSLQAEPCENESFTPGKYNVTASICEGTCGSIHPDSFTMAEKSGAFFITDQYIKKIVKH